MQTAMLPAERLDGGTVALSASLDEPGALAFPRLNAQGSVGLGGGEIAANVGATPSSVGGGLAGRVYLPGSLNVEMQAQAARVVAPQAAALVGVQGVPSDRWPVYLGVRGGVLSGRNAISDAPTERQTAPLVGATIGVGAFELGGNWRLQAELEANVPIPLAATDRDDLPLPPARLSVGIFRLID
jgi:hypothetical protein